MRREILADALFDEREGGLHVAEYLARAAAQPWGPAPAEVAEAMHCAMQSSVDLPLGSETDQFCVVDGEGDVLAVLTSDRSAVDVGRRAGFGNPVQVVSWSPVEDDLVGGDRRAVRGRRSDINVERSCRPWSHGCRSTSHRTSCARISPEQPSDLSLHCAAVREMRQQRRRCGVPAVLRDRIRHRSCERPKVGTMSGHRPVMSFGGPGDRKARRADGARGTAAGPSETR